MIQAQNKTTTTIGQSQRSSARTKLEPILKQRDDAAHSLSPQPNDDSRINSAEVSMTANSNNKSVIESNRYKQPSSLPDCDKYEKHNQTMPTPDHKSGGIESSILKNKLE
mmetsp:Transcript_32538/g.29387  ORF Transcript_32538/g.29387 Transcript_32538/m.29387 type:complete len:110 (-) Transcript_32538:196-525(-)